MFNAANRSSTANLLTNTALLQETLAATQQWLPSDFISGWLEDGVNISFPIASLAVYNMTAANADATTGDARAVVAALCSRIFDWHQSLTEQPGAMLSSIKRRRMQTGDWAGTDKQSYTFEFYLEYPESTVTDEV